MLAVFFVTLPTRRDRSAEKQRNLPAGELAKIVAADITERQFLVNGQLTRSIYDESCTFQDECAATLLRRNFMHGASTTIRAPSRTSAPPRFHASANVNAHHACLRIDTYTLDKWMVGTAKLFDGKQSHVDLVGQVEADAKEVRFRFSEVLCFNVPLLKPKIPLTGIALPGDDHCTQ